jgi:amidase
MEKPSAQALRKISEEHNFKLSERQLVQLAEYISNNLIPPLEKLLQELAGGAKPKVKYERNPGYFPRSEENKFGAWSWRCSIKGSGSGLLAGKRVALKDNVSVAGIPLTDGTALFKDYVPEIDATIVTRILDAGGEILGKATCENLCYSGGSHTSYPQIVLNPRNTSRMAGGSSSGSAVLVSTGEVDVAIGADQGGSIRVPSSWCGIFGLKPTWGLVPYTGVVSGEMTEDHVGPMARTIPDLAALLQAIAGRDELDPRQSLANAPMKVPDYVGSLKGEVRELRIGIVKEAFEWKESEKDVGDAVMEAGHAYEKLGATVEQVSIPEHKNDSPSILAGIDWVGSYRNFNEGGQGHGWPGFYDPRLARCLASPEVKRRGNDLSVHAMVMVFLGEFLSESGEGYELYSIASNLRRQLKDAYDKMLTQYDLLLMPTTPQKAQPFPKKGDELTEFINAGWNMLQNTAPFNVTGHPALNVSCGFSEGLPIGAMLVGKHFDETTILNAAYAFEQMPHRER